MCKISMDLVMSEEMWSDPFVAILAFKGACKMSLLA